MRWQHEDDTTVFASRPVSAEAMDGIALRTEIGRRCRSGHTGMSRCASAYQTEIVLDAAERLEQRSRPTSSMASTSAMLIGRQQPIDRREIPRVLVCAMRDWHQLLRTRLERS